MIQTISSFAPILILIWLMTKRNALPSQKALPLVALITYALMLFVFRHDVREIYANVVAGLLTAWTPILIIAGAIFLFKSMEVSGAMDVMRKWLNRVTPNRVGQLMIVGWAFAFLIEGASGFGTPAALAAPILVGLGFQPLSVAMMVLVMNTVPVSFGAVGTPTWFGFSALDLTQVQIQAIGIQTALIQGVASLIIPVFALRFVVGWKEIKENLLFVYLSIAVTMLPYIFIAFFNYEFPALAGGAVGLLLSVLIAGKGWGLSKTSSQEDSAQVRPKELLKATFPLWGTLLLLIVTRIPQLGLKSLLNMTEPSLSFLIKGIGELSISSALVLGLSNILETSVSWSHKILYVPSILPFGVIALLTFLFYRVEKKKVLETFQVTCRQMRNPTIALLGALVFVKLMMMGGERAAVSQIGQVLADLTGNSWYAFAAVLGAVGSFFSGSNTISNLTFGPIQQTIASNLGLNEITVLALQSVGGAMGNMVCINNIVAVCSVLAIENKEGFILTRTVRVLIPYAVIAASAAFVIVLL